MRNLRVRRQTLTKRPLLFAGSYVFTEIPEFLAGTEIIHTANDDKYSDPTDLEWLCFDVTGEATVYIMYDGTAIDSVPAWLTDLAVGQHTALVQADLISPMNIWIYYTSGAENVCLGGNNAPGVGSHYLVAVGAAMDHVFPTGSPPAFSGEFYFGTAIPSVAGDGAVLDDGTGFATGRDGGYDYGWDVSLADCTPALLTPALLHSCTPALLHSCTLSQ